MKSVSLKSALTASVKAARAAGKVMRDNWYAPKKVNLAEAHDIKLELDVRCQAIIEKTLARAFPQIPVLGEEGDTGDVNAEYRWVIDPIDGTVNYAYGIPHAATSIALQHRGQSVVGVIYDPFTDELWTTTTGQPTRLNGKVVRVGFSNSYRGTSDETAITRLVGEHAARFFKQSFELKIKGDVIPDAAVEPLLAELQELFARHGASAALSAKATIKPTKEFHAARHTLLSVEQNHELDKIVPVSASVKTKLGRGGSDDD